MSDVEVTIYAPYDSSVSSSVLEESLPVWESIGWTRTQAAPQQAAPQSAPAAQPEPTPAPNASPTPKP